MIDSNGIAAPSAQSDKRLRRAAAARTLLTLHEAGQLAHPERWTWDTIDALPNWCLQDEHTRNRLQLLCGALVLAPEVRLWIDRELILAAHILIGKQSFNTIVAKADQAPITINASAAARFKSVSGEEAILDSVRTALLQAGASVLKASLVSDLPIDAPALILGDTAGDVSYKLANTLLSQAELLIGETHLTDNEIGQVAAGDELDVEPTDDISSSDTDVETDADNDAESAELVQSDEVPA